MAWRGRIFSGFMRVADRLHLQYALFGLVALSPAHRFTDYFGGLEDFESVTETFGKKTGEVLDNLRVHFIAMGGYMGVNPVNGHLIVNPSYLNSGDETDIYLDLVHELVHVRQWMEGKRLFEPGYSYVERPTEVEAYRHTVEEARRLGLSDERICLYLKTEWMSEGDLRKLAGSVGVSCP